MRSLVKCSHNKPLSSIPNTENVAANQNDKAICESRVSLAFTSRMPNQHSTQLLSHQCQLQHCSWSLCRGTKLDDNRGLGEENVIHIFLMHEKESSCVICRKMAAVGNIYISQLRAVSDRHHIYSCVWSLDSYIDT